MSTSNTQNASGAKKLLKNALWLVVGIVAAYAVVTFLF